MAMHTCNLRKAEEPARVMIEEPIRILPTGVPELDLSGQFSGSGVGFKHLQRSGVKLRLVSWLCGCDRGRSGFHADVFTMRIN